MFIKIEQIILFKVVMILTFSFMTFEVYAQTNNVDDSAAIIVSAYSQSDALFSNIDMVTNTAYQLFIEQGYAHDNIYYLAADTSDNTLINAEPTVDNLAYTFTEWAGNRSLNTLTVFIAGGGCTAGKICLDEQRGEMIDGEHLNTWFNAVETAHPDIHINLIIDASYSGAFITSAGIHAPNRFIVTSTSESQTTAFSDAGLVWADALLNGLEHKIDLLSACNLTLLAISNAPQAQQRPQMDTNGDGFSNTTADFNIATQYVLFPQFTPLAVSYTFTITSSPFLSTQFSFLTFPTLLSVLTLLNYYHIRSHHLTIKIARKNHE